MYNTFTVTATLAVNASKWASMGYGPSPATDGHVKAILKHFIWQLHSPGTPSTVEVAAGGPGVFNVTVKVSVDTPWWKLGFGQRTARMETTTRFNDFVNEFSAVTHLVVKAS